MQDRWLSNFYSMIINNTLLSIPNKEFDWSGKSDKEGHNLRRLRLKQGPLDQRDKLIHTYYLNSPNMCSRGKLNIESKCYHMISTKKSIVSI